MKDTNTAANYIKKLYMELQHEFPDAEIQIEPMPDPREFAKQKFANVNYRKQLEEWCECAKLQVDTVRQELMNDKTDASLQSNEATDNRMQNKKGVKMLIDEQEEQRWLEEFKHGGNVSKKPENNSLPRLFAGDELHLDT